MVDTNIQIFNFIIMILVWLAKSFVEPSACHLASHIDLCFQNSLDLVLPFHNKLAFHDYPIVGLILV